MTWVPPQSVVLVHGAGSGPWIFEDWLSACGSAEVVVPDLYATLDPATAGMADLAEVVCAAVSAAAPPAAVVGWSMGGLVAMLALQQLAPKRIAQSAVLLEASPPGEVQGFDDSIAIVDGTFDPEIVYGAFPAGMRSRLESSRARAERKRGISVPSLPCPALVVAGESFGDRRGVEIARRYGLDELRFPTYDHWQLVTEPSVRQAIVRYVETGRSAPAAPPG
jgi:pimeloyl-ACP methyl ester carboxylesterase